MTGIPCQLNDEFGCLTVPILPELGPADNPRDSLSPFMSTFPDTVTDPVRRPAPLRRVERVLLLVGACGLLLGFGLAARLEPDARGYGTHQQLGLPPCSFRMLLSLPCPSCGGTTCFALFVRGRWWQAVSANAATFVLACVCAGLIPWSLVCAVRGRLWGIRRLVPSLSVLLLALTAVALVNWIVRLVVVVG